MSAKCCPGEDVCGIGMVWLEEGDEEEKAMRMDEKKEKRWECKGEVD